MTRCNKTCQVYVIKCGPSRCHKRRPKPTPPEVLTTGLRNPSGFTRVPDGSIYITQPGLTDPTLPPSGAPTFTGRISQLLPNGTLNVILDNQLGIQAAAEGITLENIGLADIAYLNGTLYVLKNFGAATGLVGPDSTSGVFQFDPVAKTLTLIADLGAFDVANCPATSPNCCVTVPPPPLIATAPSPFAMVAANGKLYVTNGHTDTIDVVDPTLPLGSNISRLVNFSDVLTPGAAPCQGAHPVLTGITVSPKGDALYVVQLTPFESQPTPPPGPPNNATVWRVDFNGHVTPIATGYSYGQGVAVDCDGSIYITQFATYISSQGAYTNPGSLVRFRPDTHTFETILNNLTLPGEIKIYGHYLYLLNYTQTGTSGQGQLLRLNLCPYRRR
jgi:DNA-binding beta-propeller fold protein YncE